LAVSGDINAFGVAVDSTGNIYIADDEDEALKELPYGFVVPTAKFESLIAGNDTLAAVLPTNALQYAPFIPASDQSWLTITGVTNGMTSFSFTTNTAGVPRTAHINLLTESIDITQSAVVLGTTNLLEGPATGTDSVMLVVPPPMIPLTASASVSWLHITAAIQPVIGGTNVLFTFDANPGITRTGTISIRNQTVTVTQAGASYVAAPAPLTALVPNGIRFSYESFLYGSLISGGLAIDNTGDVYIADPGNHAIKEWVAASNSVTTVVSGLGRPVSVALDSVDNLLFFADALSNTVEACVLPDPHVFPVVNTGVDPLVSIAIDGSDNVYIAQDPSYRSEPCSLERWNISDGSFSLLASNLYNPDVILDNAGDCYISGLSNFFAGVYEWVAGTGNVITRLPGLNDPTGVAMDGSGNFYLADAGAVEKWNAVTGNLSTLIPNGSIYATGVILDNARNLYIADYLNGAVEEIPRAFVDSTTRLEPSTAGR
jgi:hypothetical protein